MTNNQPRLLTPRQRWLRGTVGVALILLYPSCHVVRFYWDTEEMRQLFGSLVRELERKPGLMERAPIRCGRGRQSETAVPAYELAEDVEHAASGFCSPVHQYDEGPLGDRRLMWDLDFDPVRPMTRLMATTEAVYELTSHTWDVSSNECERASPDEVPEFEARIAADVKRRVAKLRSYLPRVRELAAQHERMRPVLAGLAWTLLLIEFAGGFSLLALGWGWMIRRGREREQPPPEDPHWRTTAAGEQAPRTSPWFLALILFGALGTTALMMLAQRC